MKTVAILMWGRKCSTLQAPTKNSGTATQTVLASAAALCLLFKRGQSCYLTSFAKRQRSRHLKSNDSESFGQYNCARTLESSRRLLSDLLS